MLTTQLLEGYGSEEQKNSTIFINKIMRNENLANKTISFLSENDYARFKSVSRDMNGPILRPTQRELLSLCGADHHIQSPLQGMYRGIKEAKSNEELCAGITVLCICCAPATVFDSASLLCRVIGYIPLAIEDAKLRALN